VRALRETTIDPVSGDNVISQSKAIPSRFINAPTRREIGRAGGIAAHRGVGNGYSAKGGQRDATALAIAAPGHGVAGKRGIGNGRRPKPVIFGVVEDGTA